jgi:hypothetical protein
LQLWRQIGGKAAKPIKRRERKPTLVSVARQVAKAELPATAYEFRPDGTILAVVGKPNTVADETDDVTPEDRDQWPKSNSRSSIPTAILATGACGTNSAARAAVGSC